MSADTAKAVVRRYFDAYNTQRHDAVMALVHPDHVYHPPGGGASMDRRERQADEAPFFAAFTEIESLVDDDIAEGDRVATRVTMRGTHTGSYHGRPPTGRRVVITLIDFCRVREGKILEEWAEFDSLGLVQQLGSEPR